MKSDSILRENGGKETVWLSLSKTKMSSKNLKLKYVNDQLHRVVTYGANICTLFKLQGLA